MRKVIFAIVMLAVSVNAGASQRLSMHVGEIKLLRLSPIERVAVGQAAVMSTSLLKNGQLLMLAEGEGSTTVHLWFENGKESTYNVDVTKEDNHNIAATLNNLLAGIPGVEAQVIGDQIVLRGDVPPEYDPVVSAVIAKYPNVIDVTSKTANLVRQLLSDVEGLTVSTVGTNVVLRGDIHQYDVPIIEKVTAKFPDLMDLTTATGVPEDRMIFMNVKITEFNKNKLTNLGINWDNPIAGPSAAFAVDVAANETFRPVATTPAFGNGLPVDLTTSPLGFFGLATEIGSRINFLVNSGDALILAEPRLSTRSGGEATFLAGGEVPLPTTGSLGQSNVEFKEFGISMSISPVVDSKDRISATVATEISAIDNSVSVNGIPGFLTRKTETDISMNAGETLVISGLLDQQASKDTEKLAGLGDIPILGVFFRNKNVRNVERELVIFVTPTVFDAESELNQSYLRRREDNIKQFKESVGEPDLQILE
ncbi:MAG: pilus assembly protein CpaC [Gammaproteobacteria bacterium]|jgi:pilus assembly protein CpaC